MTRTRGSWREGSDHLAQFYKLVVTCHMVTERRIVVAGPYLDVSCTATVTATATATVPLPHHQSPQDDDGGGECHGHSYNGHYGFNRHVGHCGERDNNG